MQIHILNGDALKEQFPDIPGEVLVMRECLMDGPVKSQTIEQLYHLRSDYMSGHYDGISREDYYRMTVPELNRILELDGTSGEINLWFEDDLFCQVNLWFLLHHLKNSEKIYLVRPPALTGYGFGGLTSEELLATLEQRTALSLSGQLEDLWPAYRENDTGRLQSLGSELEEQYPFITQAIQAHIESLPTSADEGRPKRVIREIISELGTTSTGPVFREFCRREPIYGYGDLQFIRILNEVTQASGADKP